jgi:hypothetical protein
MARPNSDISNGTPIDRPRSIDRYTVPEAARALDISPEAVRNRLSRGTLESTKENGTVYVLLTADMVRHTADRSSDGSSDRPGGTSLHIGDTPGDPSLLISAKEETISVLKAQLEAERAASAELRRIVAGLVQRVPELEPAKDPSSEPSESPLMYSGETDKDRGSPEQQEPSERRSWLHQFFFGP